MYRHGGPARDAVGARPLARGGPRLPPAAVLGALVAASRPAWAQEVDPTNEIVVRGDPVRREVTRERLDASELERAPGSLGDPLRAVLNLPGLARPSFLSGALIVRGAAPADSLVVLDGVALPSAYHFGGLQSTLPAEALSRVDFVPGNFSARYGRATGGLVELGLREPRRQGARTALHIGVLDVGAFHERALSPALSAAVSARLGWVGYIVAPIVEAIRGDRSALTYGDYQAQVDWHPDRRDHLRVMVVGVFDSFSHRAPARGSETELGLGYHLIQARWTRRLGAAGELATSLSAGWNDQWTRNAVEHRAPGLGRMSVELQSVPVQLRSELRLRPRPNLSVYLGLDGALVARALRFTPRPSAGESPARPSRADDAVIVQPGAYVEVALSPARALRIRAGLRLDLLSGEAVLSPRFDAELSAWRGGTLKLAVGTFSQPVIDERPNVPPELLLLADRIGRDLGPRRPERAVHLSLGVEQRLSRRVTLRVEGFWKDITGATVGFPSVDLTLAGQASDRADGIRYDGRGRVVGLELLLRHAQGDRFMGWIAYTLMRAERTDGPGTPWRPFDFDQTHVLTALASVRLGRGWEVGARFRYVTGRPSALPREVYVGLAGASYTLPPALFQDRVPDFHQLDLRVEKRWARPWGAVTLHLEFLNVYNRANAEQVRWDLDRRAYAADGAAIPFVPNFGVRGEF